MIYVEFLQKLIFLLLSMVNRLSCQSFAVKILDIITLEPRNNGARKSDFFIRSNLPSHGIRLSLYSIGFLPYAINYYQVGRVCSLSYARQKLQLPYLLQAIM